MFTLCQPICSAFLLSPYMEDQRSGNCHLGFFLVFSGVIPSSIYTSIQVILGPKEDLSGVF